MTTFIKTKYKKSEDQKKIDKKIIQIGPQTRKLDFCGPERHLRKVQYRIWNLHQISKSKKKNYSIRSINKEIGLLWSGHLGKVQYQILNPQKISKSKKKNYSNRTRNNEISL